MVNKTSQNFRQRFQNFLKKEIIIILASGTILLIFGVSRLYNLLSFPIFADEAIYLRWSQVMMTVPSLRFMPLSDGKQPLFMWVVIPFLKLFEDPLVAGRLVSVICGFGSLIGIILLSQLIFKNRKISLISALLYSISPYFILYDRMALADSMLTMFGIWAIFFGVLSAKTLRLDFAMLTGFVLGGASLTKSPAIFFYALIPLSIIISNWISLKKIYSLKMFKLVGLWVVSSTIGYGIYNILRLGSEFHMIAIRNKDYVLTFSELIHNPYNLFLNNFLNSVSWLWILVPGVVMLIAIIISIVRFKKYWKEIIFLNSWFLIPLILEYFFAKVFTARYILFVIPPLFILGAFGITELFNYKKRFSYILFGIVLIPTILMDYFLVINPEKAKLPARERAGYLEQWTAGTGVREVANYIKSQKLLNPEIGILVATDGYFGTLPDGLMIYLSDIPDIVVKGIGVTTFSVDDTIAVAKRNGSKVYVVINSSRLIVEPERLGFKLINRYDKAVQSSGKQESLLLFEVTDQSVVINEKDHREKDGEKPKF